VLRAVAAIAVIVVHASYWPLQNSGADRAVWQSVTLLARFCVPAFVLLTGLVLGFRYTGRRLGGAFLLRRARRSLVPWLIWAPIFCIADLVWIGTLSPTGSSLGSFLSGGAGHLYFLILVPQLYVLLLFWPVRRRPLLLLTAGAMLLQVGLSLVRLYVPLGSGVVASLMLDHGFELFPFWIGFFALGVLGGRWLAARRGAGLPAWPFVLAVPMTAAWLLWDGVSHAANARYAQGTGAFLRPLLLPLALAVCGAVLFGAPRLLRRAPRLHRAALVLSRHSLGVYIVHPLLLAALGPWLMPALHVHLPWSIVPFLAITLASLAGALAFTAVIARTPLAGMVGEERLRRREVEVVGRRAA
jgi:surface polysaccharide O-acyltransferase-like enzyme